MQKANKEIRIKAQLEGVYLYQIAQKLGISYPTLINWLRVPLSEEKENKIMTAISELSKEVSE